ncbi:hypothetical protein KUTeg_020384 [Tegillarca granosa]|uniref:Uncharacterized protein n=1 Tax=Tegillarca granosa TaxID=220873 RepID=A0ABQ9EBY2_TEGGR|nr:hypothetical protein KUTeg_020384 [Tegillarca granosa]
MRIILGKEKLRLDQEFLIIQKKSNLVTLMNTELINSLKKTNVKNLSRKHWKGEQELACDEKRIPTPVSLVDTIRCSTEFHSSPDEGSIAVRNIIVQIYCFRHARQTLALNMLISGSVKEVQFTGVKQADKSFSYRYMSCMCDCLGSNPSGIPLHANGAYFYNNMRMVVVVVVVIASSSSFILLGKFICVYWKVWDLKEVFEENIKNRFTDKILTLQIEIFFHLGFDKMPFSIDVSRMCKIKDFIFSENNASSAPILHGIYFRLITSTDAYYGFEGRRIYIYSKSKEYLNGNMTIVSGEDNEI